MANADPVAGGSRDDEGREVGQRGAPHSLRDVQDSRSHVPRAEGETPRRCAPEQWGT